MKKHYSITATLITIFSMLGSICAADKGATQNFYKLFWTEGKEATYSKRDTKNYIVVHEDCTPNNIRHVLMNEQLYKWWQGNKHNNNYNSKDVYITLFSEEGIRINSNYNWKSSNGKGYFVWKNKYEDNNNHIPVKDLIKEANSSQKPIINTRLNSKRYSYVIIGTKIMLTAKAISNINYHKIEEFKKTSTEKRQVKENNKITKDNKRVLTNNKFSPVIPMAAISNLKRNKTSLNNKGQKGQGILEKSKIIAKKNKSDLEEDNNNKPNNNNDDINKINPSDTTKPNNRVDNSNNINDNSNELLDDTDNEVQPLQENEIIVTQESYVQINNKNDSSDKSMVDKSNNIKSSSNELLDDTDNEVKPPQENKIIETQESDTQTDNNDKVTNNSSKEDELGNDNASVDSSNKPNNNKDNINEEDSDDDTSDNNNKDNEQSKTEKSNTNKKLIHPEYKEILSDIEEGDDELLNNDDEEKNKKLTVGKVIACLTVISLFGIGGFYIYKNGHKLTKPDVKKKKKKQQ